VLGPAPAQIAAAAPTPVSSAQFPPNLQFESITAGPGGLLMSGTATIAGNSGVDCLSAEVNPLALSLSHLIEPRCDDPRISGEPFMAVSQPLAGGLADDLRIARLSPLGTGNIELGPVIATYEEASDTHLESALGGGTLWLYVAAPRASPNHSEAIEVSEASGQVLQKALLPWVLTRPVVTADDEGLYIAPSIESGFSAAGAKSEVTIFRVGPTSRSAQPFYVAGTGGLGGGEFTNWMVGDGSALWAEVCRHLSTTNACHVLRFDRLVPRPALTSAETAQTDDWAVGNGVSGIFSSLFPSSTVTGAEPTSTTIVKIDPSNGAQTTVASVTLPAYWGELSYDANPDAALYDGALYLLGPSGQTSLPVGGPETVPTTLYRVPVGAPA